MKRGAHDISTCKSVVKRTQEDDDSALCSHTHPHFNNSDMLIFSRILFSSHALAASIDDALTHVGILSFLYDEARALLVRLALVVGIPRSFSGRKTNFGRTLDDVFHGCFPLPFLTEPSGTPGLIVYRWRCRTTAVSRGD